MLMFIQGCYSPKNETVIFDLGFAKFCEEGALYALKIITTLLVFLGTFYIMNKTTYTGKLVASTDSIRIKPQGGYLVLASLNVVPQMQRRECHPEAQSARGVETGGKPVRQNQSFIPLLGPVVMSSPDRCTGERNLTLETRGFGIKNVKQTTYGSDQSTVDKILKVLLITFFVVVLILTILMKLNII